MESKISVEEVRGEKGLKKFIEFTYSLYRGNRYFVPPLYFDVMNTLREDVNPAFEFCEAKYFMVYSDGKPAGRVAAIVNHKANEIWNNRLGRVGWMDFIDSEQAVNALFGAAEEWLKEKGMDGVHGPLGFTDLDPEGMLIDGFDELGTLPMIYNYDYYPVHMERMGYAKDTDWIEFEVKTPAAIPEKVERVNRMVMEKLKLRILNVRNSKELLPYSRKMFALQNESYAHLYGFTPLTEKQMDFYTKQYFGFVNPDYLKIIVDEKDNVAAFGIAMPSLSRALQRSGGKLFPFGFIHILYALKFPRQIDLYLIAVRKDIQNMGVNAVLMTEINRSCIKNGIVSAETSGELETNLRVQSLWKHFETRQHKRRRCYVKHFK